MKSFWPYRQGGKVRKDNQDCFIIESCPVRSCLIAALCDGMGGENAGGDRKRSREQGFRLVYIRSSHVQDDQKRQLQGSP